MGLSLVGDISVQGNPMPGGAVRSRQSLRGICGGALRPVTWKIVNRVEIGSQVISPGVRARDEGQEQLRRPICLSLSSYEYRIFTDSPDLLKETL